MQNDKSMTNHQLARSSGSSRVAQPPSAVRFSQTPRHEQPQPGAAGLHPLAMRRGSALLLVIGLLTIIAMLGSTFLLISRMDRIQAVAVAARSQAEPLARGLCNQVAMKLMEDLKVSTDGPYTSTTANDFIDYPTADGWLFYQDATWFQRSTLLDGTSQGNADTDGYDGDGTEDNTDTQDAIWKNTGVFNDLGREYQAAVRVEDLSGKLNVNTAYRNYSTSSMPAYNAPVLIDLTSAIGETLMNGTTGLNASRCGGTAQNAEDTNTYIALRVLSPLNNCTPFAIGDELFLRWLKDDASTETGRLYDVIASLSETTRQRLTTYNCSRDILRNPTADLKTRIPLNTTQYTTPFSGLTAPSGLDDQTTRNTLVSHLVAAGVDKDVAGHLVANLAAYADGQNQSKAYETSYTDGADVTTYYGVVPQAVLSEAFAKGERDGDDNLTEVQAIEIFNPTGSTLSGYKLKCGTNTFDLADLSANSYTVIHHSKGSPDADFVTLPGDAVEWTNLDFDGQDVQLIRTAGGTDIVVDEIGLDYQPPNTGDTTTETAGKARDTSTTNLRYLVALAADTSTSTLGSDNNKSSEGDITTAGGSPIWFGYKIPTPDANGVLSLAELCDQLVTGHKKDNANAWTPLTKNLADNFTVTTDQNHTKAERLPSVSPGVCRGRANIFCQQTPSSPYPAISVGLVLAEMTGVIPVDLTREHSDGTASRVYGRVNINTATREELLQLPWPSTINSRTVDTVTLVDNYILPYREMTTGSQYELRTGSAGFYTPGELAIPLGHYFDDNLANGKTLEDADFFDLRNELYAAVANCLTVNSDTFAVFIAIRLPKIENPASSANYYTWNYVGVIDRSNCRETGDTPAVLLFSPVK